MNQALSRIAVMGHPWTVPVNGFDVRSYGGAKKKWVGSNIFGDISGALLGGLGQGINRGLSGLFGGGGKRAGGGGAVKWR